MGVLLVGPNARLKMRWPTRDDIRACLRRCQRRDIALRTEALYREVHEMADVRVEQLFAELQRSWADNNNLSLERRVWTALIAHLQQLPAPQEE
jgi:hypothetical protein